jgi:ring-1,2-phenylacetyl-CoA epoxidase subunit PaaE
LIKQVLHDEPTARLHLFYSNSTPASAIFLQQLQALEEVYRDRFDIEWFFSDHADLTKARLGTYTLRSLMNRKMVFAKRDALVFTCGPYDYMKMVEITWLSEGFERNHFRKEIYDPENILPAYKLYYDHTDRVITIETGGRQHRVQVHWNQTILDAALKAGLPLRYNCKAGRCSSCVCTVKSGKVWMHYNEVLTPSDEERNLALTCTGHPASGDVWILV